MTVVSNNLFQISFQNGIFNMSGRLDFPESVNYEKFYKLLYTYMMVPNNKTKIIIKPETINQKACDFLNGLFDVVERMSKSGRKIEVLWICAEDEKNMKEKGIQFGSNLNVPFEYIWYDKKEQCVC
jgi:hypothetical protein